MADVFAFPRFLQVKSLPSETIRLLHKVSFISLVSQGQRRYHPRYTATNHESLLGKLNLDFFHGFKQRRLCHGHTHKVLGLFGGLFRFGRMYPGVLIPNIRHFKQKSVQTGFTQSFLEQWLMSPGRAGGNHHPVQPVFLNRFHHIFLRVLRAGKKIFARVHHVRKSFRIFHNFRHPDHAAYIDAAVADKNADSGLFSRYLCLLRVRFALSQAAPHFGQCHLRGGSGGACFHDRVRNIFRPVEGSAHENTVSGSCNRGKRRCFGKTVEV